ncbi:uncharacterized protein LOC112539766 [Tetranychus urticae]|uniref:uncharacterized protein LOC112539766 n=1 Tax=Tetranychus urticae TaxID=32264 RepID=UPI000D64E0A0|nr:uncharacterized protein LOC112539766 [Tetranychus urticae]
MLINELPDDCLLTIFDYIQDLRDLINCFKVSKNWRIKIVERTKKLQYLIDQPNYSSDYVYLHLKEPIDVKCLSKLFPNLRIAEFSYQLNGGAPIEDMVRLIINSNSLKGIIFDCDNHLEFGLVPENANLEMLSTGYIYPKMSGIYENVKQLHLWNYNLGLFESVAHCFPNLERLQIYATEDLSEQYSDAPVLANLKILEMGLPLNDWANICCSFKFMDAYPALQSAYIKIDSRTITFNHLITRDNLRDLVIQFYQPIEWNELSRCMLKYPNLKHLALRGTSLKDEHIMQLILILPKLTILDIRKSYGVSQEADNYVRDYCEQYGRSIKFYFKPFDERIKSDRPQLLNRPEKICRGFDFMEHCFFKSFYELPHFLDPIDD